jgi:tetratricopeptide (TPR) repeat protein
MPSSNLGENPAAAASSEAEAHYAAACRLWEAGRRGDAVTRLDTALRLKPDSAEALGMGGYMLGEMGKPEAALRFYGRALALDPRLALAYSNAGKLLVGLGRPAEALEAFEAATALKPADADAWNGRAGALRELGRLEESIGAARRALALKPDFAEGAINLGNALLKLDRIEEALEAYRRARAARSDYAPALCGEALALRDLGRYDEALAAFEAAEALGSREAVAGKGCLLLTLGDFERGFEGYEARWLQGKSLAEALGARYPTWAGPGRGQDRVLVLNDHGLGDTLQFVRYLPLMAAAGVEATFVCPPKLHRLLRSTMPARLVAAPPEAPFDAQIAVSSLPHAFRTRLDTVPADVPYLAAEPALSARWAARIGAAGYKIGVVWQGNPHPEADPARSFPLAAAASLASLPGVRLVSLQKGFSEEQIDGLPRGMKVETLGEEFDCGPDAFVDAAAAMTNCDLIVTCDTSIAHLAGALARPVWVALKSDAEWRWMVERDDSPWYPTMRLFRQPRRGAWPEVFEAMARALSAPLAARRSTPALRAPCSIGDLIDRITILRIKRDCMVDEDKRANVRRELDLLEVEAQGAGVVGGAVEAMTEDLAEVNARLWAVEDALRACEREQDFGPRFVALARSVYALNDQRAALKRVINKLFDSALVEEKSYGFVPTGPSSIPNPVVARPKRELVAGFDCADRRALMQADADQRPAPPGGPGAAHIARLVEMHGESPRQADVAGEQDLQAVQRAIADATVAQIPEGGVENLR